MHNLVLLMGAPGSGKGTQGMILSKFLGIKHFSTGDVFRNMASENTLEGKELSRCIKSGKLVSSDLVNSVVKNFLASKSSDKGCILDGYPRSLDQAKYLLNNFKGDITVLFFKVDNSIALKRILGRFNCVNCKKIYNKFFMNTQEEGICDVCNGSDFIFRDDDNTDIILSRLQEYEKETLPVIDFLKDKSKLYEVNANKSSDEVEADIISIAEMI
ncbi:MAG: hypothetical protein DGJ47_000510 [Rickettsiaceae bacterium]